MSRVRPQLETSREADGQSLTVMVRVSLRQVVHASAVQQVPEPHAEFPFYRCRCETSAGVTEGKAVQLSGEKCALCIKKCMRTSEKSISCQVHMYDRK